MPDIHATATRALAAFGLLVALASGTVRAEAEDASALATRFGCASCHTPEKRVVGPSFKEVAAKYASDPAAKSALRQKIRTGGSGVWGAIPMPPTSGATDAQIDTLVDWILSIK